MCLVNNSSGVCVCWVRSVGVGGGLEEFFCCDSLDYRFKKKKSSMSVYYYQFKYFGCCPDALFTCYF